MISSRILARISESMMWPETSTTSVALMVRGGYLGRTRRPRVFRRFGRNLGDRDLVRPHGRDGFEALLALVPEVPHDDLDGAGGRDGQQRAHEAGQLDADQDRQQD